MLTSETGAICVTVSGNPDQHIHLELMTNSSLHHTPLQSNIVLFSLPYLDLTYSRLNPPQHAKRIVKPVQWPAPKMNQVMMDAQGSSTVNENSTACNNDTRNIRGEADILLHCYT